jgi:hypothetical protein
MNTLQRTFAENRLAWHEEQAAHYLREADKMRDPRMKMIAIQWSARHQDSANKLRGLLQAAADSDVNLDKENGN